MLDIGRICVKTAGREAGRICCIVKKIDPNFVMITGPSEVSRVKRRKCNILHLEPLQEKVKISADATDNDILKAYQEVNILQKFNLHLPTKEELKALAEKKMEKEKGKRGKRESGRRKKS